MLQWKSQIDAPEEEDNKESTGVEDFFQAAGEPRRDSMRKAAPKPSIKPKNAPVSVIFRLFGPRGCGAARGS